MSTDKTSNVTDLSVASIDRMRNRIRSVLVERNISARSVSRRAGFNPGYVGDLLEGRSKSPDFERILKLADALELPVTELTGESDATPLAHLYQPGPADDDSAVPLFAARIAMNKPWVPVGVRPLDHVPGLPNHPASEGVYAVAVFNDLNAPRYFLGETIFVSPVAPIKAGDFIFARTKDGDCSIGRLASVDGDSATWTLVGSGEDVTAKMTDLEAFHRIVGSVA